MTAIAKTLPIQSQESAIFQAAWPESLKPTTTSKIADFAWNLFSLIVFPVGIARVIRATLFHTATFLIHPANSNLVMNRLISGYKKYCEDFREKHKENIVTFKTPDGKTLEGYLYRGSSTSSNRRAILYTPGNGMCLELSKREVVRFSKKYANDADVLVLNYRGVGKTSGWSSPQSLALDTYTAGEYLHKVQGIDPSRIIYWGHSLGGYAATKGGALFQEAHPNKKISIINDRSFATLSKEVSVIMGSIVSIFIKFLGWELDATKAWDAFKGRKVVLFDYRDKTIPDKAAFRHSVANKEQPVIIELSALSGHHMEPVHFQERQSKKLATEMIQAWAG